MKPLSTPLLLIFAHVLVKPAEDLLADGYQHKPYPCRPHQTDLIVPFQRIARLKHPVVLIWEDHNSARDAATTDALFNTPHRRGG